MQSVTEGTDMSDRKPVTLMWVLHRLVDAALATLWIAEWVLFGLIGGAWLAAAHPSVFTLLFPAIVFAWIGIGIAGRVSIRSFTDEALKDWK